MKNIISYAIMLIFLVFFFWTIYPALKGQLTVTFAPHTIPQDYTLLEKFVQQQNYFFRTLWIPTYQHYGYYSNENPFIEGENFFYTTDLHTLVQELKKSKTKVLVDEASVRYIIVPYDSDKEIFLTDRRYDQNQYLSTIESLKKISWLHQISGFGKIAVFVVDGTKDHIWSPNATIKTTYQYINPTEYLVTVVNAKKGDNLIFSDAFDNNWQMKIGSRNLSSIKFDNRFNSFILPSSGSYKVTIFYASQKWVTVGEGISGVSILVISLYLFISVYKIISSEKLFKYFF